LIVKGLPKEKQFDWKEQLLADKECGKSYECVYCWKPLRERWVGVHMVTKDQNNVKVSGKKLYVSMGYCDTDTMPEANDYLSAFQIVLDEMLPGYALTINTKVN